MYKCLIDMYIYMSGTAALAAARKRRANPQPTSNSTTQNYNSNSNSTSMTSIKEEGELPKATNPAMLLMQHNILIQKLQKEVNELKESKKNDLKPKGDTDYKTEYLGLLEEMKEMKKVLLKVQSFSMETNLDVMKLKRTVEQNQQSHLQSQTQDRIDHTSITITNDINSFALELGHDNADTHV